MARFPFNFRPKPGRFGNQILTPSIALGTSGVALTSSATTTYVLPVVARRQYLESLSLACVTPPVGGSITAQLFVRIPGGSDVAVTAATDLTALTANSNTRVAFTVGAEKRIMPPGSLLKLSVVASTTVGTQPALQVIAETALVE